MADLVAGSANDEAVKDNASTKRELWYPSS